MPIEGLTASQFKPWFTVAVAANVIAPAELETVRF